MENQYIPICTPSSATYLYIQFIPLKSSDVGAIIFGINKALISYFSMVGVPCVSSSLTGLIAFFDIGTDSRDLRSNKMTDNTSLDS